MYRLRAIVLVLVLSTLFAGIAPVRAHAALLDDIAGATFAFSISRYLRDAEVGNPVARFRESATGNERDFKLDGSNVLVSDDVDEYTVSEFLALTSATTTYVVSVYDQSGNGRTFSHAEAARQPVLVQNSDLNGIAAMDFSDNINKKLESASISITPASGIEVHALVRPTDITIDSIVFGGFTSSLAYVAASSTAWMWQADLGDNYSATVAPVNNTNYQMSWRYLGSHQFVINENGTEILNETDAVRAIDWRTGAHAIGNHAATVNQRGFKGLIAELVFYNGIYSADDVDDIELSMQTHAGLADDAPAASLPYRVFNLGTMLLTGGTFILN